MHNPLLHRKPLLVIAPRNLERVPLELVADGVPVNLLPHAAVHEDAELAVVFDLDELLGAICGKGDVELHLDGVVVKRSAVVRVVVGEDNLCGFGVRRGFGLCGR
jgi:hypothetical protein